jgi:hypothetical protein
MPLHLLRQLAVIATPILLLAPVPPLRLSARADDAPKTAHEAAVLDRIFANWKARHDRVHSLRLTWDSRSTHLSGKTFALKRIEKRPAFEFEQLGGSLNDGSSMATRRGYTGPVPATKRTRQIRNSPGSRLAMCLARFGAISGYRTRDCRRFA